MTTKLPRTYVHCCLEVISSWLEPKTYLEIGVREGCSLKAVIKYSHPSLNRVVLCDNWSKAYGGTGRGSHEHIEQILSEYKSISAMFLDGDSKFLIPLVKENFELILVDGDHSYQGAWTDLINVWPLLSPGGILVFDDIVHPAHRDLLDCFENFATTVSTNGAVIYKELNKAHGAGVIQKQGASFRTGRRQSEQLREQLERSEP